MRRVGIFGVMTMQPQRELFHKTRSINLNRTLLSLALGLFSFSNGAAQDEISSPELLRYPDLVALYKNENPPQDLQQRLTELLSTRFVDNSINAQGVVRASSTANLLRVATWNIERGLEFDAVIAALTNDQRFFRRLTPATRPTNLVCVACTLIFPEPFCKW